MAHNHGPWTRVVCTDWLVVSDFLVYDWNWITVVNWAVDLGSTSSGYWVRLMLVLPGCLLLGCLYKCTVLLISWLRAHSDYSLSLSLIAQLDLINRCCFITVAFAIIKSVLLTRVRNITQRSFKTKAAFTPCSVPCGATRAGGTLYCFCCNMPQHAARPGVITVGYRPSST